jgi:hypothetical protein
VSVCPCILCVCVCVSRWWWWWWLVVGVCGRCTCKPAGLSAQLAEMKRAAGQLPASLSGLRWCCRHVAEARGALPSTMLELPTPIRALTAQLQRVVEIGDFVCRFSGVISDIAEPRKAVSAAQARVRSTAASVLSPLNPDLLATIEEHYAAREDLMRALRAALFDLGDLDDAKIQAHIDALGGLARSLEELLQAARSALATETFRLGVELAAGVQQAPSAPLGAAAMAGGVFNPSARFFH